MNVVNAENSSSDPCNPKRYIPRRTTEGIIRSVSALVREGEPAIVIRGPRGIGKSMLLRVLAERLSAERKVAYVSVSSAPEPELCHRVLDLLKEPATDDPAEALISAAWLAGDDQHPLLLLIDHADRSPIASSEQLVRAATSASPHLTVIFAVCEGERSDDFIEALEAQLCGIVIAFDEPMTEDEASAYVRGSLSGGELPEDLRSRLDPRTVAWITQGTNGLPREINRRALELLDRYERGLDPLLPGSPKQKAGERPGPEDSLNPAPRPLGDVGRLPSGPDRAASPPLPGLGGMLLGRGRAARYNLEVDLGFKPSLGSGPIESSPTPPGPIVAERDEVPADLPGSMPLSQLPMAEPEPAGLRTSSFRRRSLLLAFSVGAILGIAIAAGYVAGRLEPRENEPAAMETPSATAVRPSPPITATATGFAFGERGPV